LHHDDHGFNFRPKCCLLFNTQRWLDNTASKAPLGFNSFLHVLFTNCAPSPCRHFPNGHVFICGGINVRICIVQMDFHPRLTGSCIVNLYIFMYIT
uniref:Uncharacterized protein n=1 Tax=Hippocampus comes TaxID=109280 RepID=A0A3Q2Z0V6_HIPCM